MVLPSDNSSEEKIQVKINELAVCLLIPPHPLTTPGHGAKQRTLPLLDAVWRQQRDSCPHQAGGSLKPWPDFLGHGRKDLWWDAFFSSPALWKTTPRLCRKSAKLSLPVRRFKTGQNLRGIWAIKGKWIHSEALWGPFLWLHDASEGPHREKGERDSPLLGSSCWSGLGQARLGTSFRAEVEVRRAGRLTRWEETDWNWDERLPGATPGPGLP